LHIESAWQGSDIANISSGAAKAPTNVVIFTKSYSPVLNRMVATEL
jgi:hypothetical protein